jgi:hypothetical protein
MTNLLKKLGPRILRGPNWLGTLRQSVTGAGGGLRHKSAIRTGYAIHSSRFCSKAHYTSFNSKRRSTLTKGTKEGLEIDDEFEFGGLHHWQIDGLFTL